MAPFVVPLKCSVMAVGSLSCWRHAKNSFRKSCKAESSVFFKLGLDAPLGAGFAIFAAAYFVPVFGAGHIEARSRSSFFWARNADPNSGPKAKL